MCRRIIGLVLILGAIGLFLFFAPGLANEIAARGGIGPLDYYIGQLLVLECLLPLILGSIGRFLLAPRTKQTPYTNVITPESDFLRAYSQSSTSLADDTDDKGDCPQCHRGNLRAVRTYMSFAPRVGRFKPYDEITVYVCSKCSYSCEKYD